MTCRDLHPNYSTAPTGIVSSEQKGQDDSDDEPPLDDYEDSNSSENKDKQRPRAPPAVATVTVPTRRKKRAGRKHRKSRGAVGNLEVGSPADSVRVEPPARPVKTNDESEHEQVENIQSENLEDSLDAEVTADSHLESEVAIPSGLPEAVVATKKDIETALKIKEIQRKVGFCSLEKLAEAYQNGSAEFP